MNDHRFTRFLFAIFVFVGGMSILVYILAASFADSLDISNLLPSIGDAVNVQVSLPEERDASNLQIQSLAFNQNIMGVSDISFTIRNISDKPQDGIAQFIVSPANSDAPWENAIYISEAIHFRNLAPQDSYVASFPDVLEDFAPNEYSLSFWVQTRDGESSTHADGLMYWETIWLGEGIFLMIDSAALTRNENTGTYTAEISILVRNKTDETQSVALSYTISEPSNAESWHDSVYIAPFETFELLPDEHQLATYNVELGLADGDYLVTGYLHRIDNGEQSEINRVVYPNTLTIP